MAWAGRDLQAPLVSPDPTTRPGCSKPLPTLNTSRDGESMKQHKREQQLGQCFQTQDGILMVSVQRQELDLILEDPFQVRTIL